MIAIYRAVFRIISHLNRPIINTSYQANCSAKSDQLLAYVTIMSTNELLLKKFNHSYSVRFDECSDKRNSNE